MNSIRYNCKYITSYCEPYNFYCTHKKIQDAIICISIFDCDECTPEDNDWFGCCLKCDKYTKAKFILLHRIILFLKSLHAKARETIFLWRIRNE